MLKTDNTVNKKTLIKIFKYECNLFLAAKKQLKF